MMNKKSCSKALLAILFLGIAQFTTAQDDDVNLSGQQNIISTAVSFLDIAPESRGGAMGNTGVAISPDVNSQHWNPAKYAFIDKESGVALSYTPWLRKLVNDINLYYLAGFLRLDDMQTISGSIRYFSLGDITFMSEDAQPQGNASPHEFAIDAAYSRVLSDHFSGSVAFRYIRSDLQMNFSNSAGSETYQAGNSFAADLAFYYQNEIDFGGNDANLSAGINISNIGSKISYDGNIEQFIPTNLRLGTALKTNLDEYNQLTVALDLNKLLVPTPDYQEVEENNSVFQSDNVSVISGIFQSFSDAPGGMEEELQEINVSVGAEYLYNKQFAVRAGYFHEHENKGNRKYFTAGVGLKFNMLSIDASYIIPVVQNNPLANTVRFTLGLDLDQMIGQ
ncbi:type IX secretion system outer membrane channel protein PorV [Marinilabilia salmonicolor]|uniref:type IX secretion system outer membrane channel protein PorV n=1 Tax=Marinilabilia salmonicolor TaxID=989 RepID=UPI00029A94F8|nr:type IX secretion system outer membrane channel protein PorV [Marinilabilia salmonicolor]